MFVFEGRILVITVSELLQNPETGCKISQYDTDKVYPTKRSKNQVLQFRNVHVTFDSMTVTYSDHCAECHCFT
jgi:hypothetical protein